MEENPPATSPPADAGSVHADAAIAATAAAEEDNECCICKADLCERDPSEEPGYALECGHSFHTSCIVRWFRTAEHATGCPVCRAEPRTAQAILGETSEAQDASDDSSMTSLEVPLHERDMNGLLRDHLCFSRRRNCPASTKVKVQKYRESRQNMIEKRRELYRHERDGIGRYVDLRRKSIRLHGKLLTAQSRFVRRAMLLYSTPLEAHDDRR
jgi:hypothetical protein